jgi:hypothetical protein
MKYEVISLGLFFAGHSKAHDLPITTPPIVKEA